MNRLFSIFIYVIMFGLIAANVSAEMNSSTPKNNAKTNYDELSAAEFFYGVLINHNNEAVRHPQALRIENPESPQQAYNALSASEFFYGYPTPKRLEATATNHSAICNEGAAGHATLSEVLNPAIFFGYVDVNTNKGICSNC
jgi:hypothetical protein